VFYNPFRYYIYIYISLSLCVCVCVYVCVCVCVRVCTEICRKGEEEILVYFGFRTALPAHHAGARAASSADEGRLGEGEGGRWAQVFPAAYSGAKWCGRYD